MNKNIAIVNGNQIGRVTFIERMQKSDLHNVKNLASDMNNVIEISEARKRFGDGEKVYLITGRTEVIAFMQTNWNYKIKCKEKEVYRQKDDRIPASQKSPFSTNVLNLIYEYNPFKLNRTWVPDPRNDRYLEDYNIQAKIALKYQMKPNMQYMMEAIQIYRFSSSIDQAIVDFLTIMDVDLRRPVMITADYRTMTSQEFIKKYAIDEIIKNRGKDLPYITVLNEQYIPPLFNEYARLVIALLNRMDVSVFIVDENKINVIGEHTYSDFRVIYQHQDDIKRLL